MDAKSYLHNKQPIIEKTFQRALEENHLSHAYLLVGDAGIPLKELGLYLCKSILCLEPNPLADCCCKNCLRIDRQEYPDFVFLNGEDGSIKKETIQDLQTSFSSTALEKKGIKVYFINHAEAMTTEAMNALLKFLEEPLPNVYGFLSANNEEKVLPTIVSRCENLRFRLTDSKAVIEEAIEKGAKIEDAELLSPFYNDADLVIEKASTSDYLSAKNAINEYTSAFSDGLSASRQAIAGTVIDLIDNKNSLRQFLDFVVLFLTECVRVKNGRATTLSSYDTIIQGMAEAIKNPETKLQTAMSIRTKSESNINTAILLMHLANELSKEQ